MKNYLSQIVKRNQPAVSVDNAQLLLPAVAPPSPTHSLIEELPMADPASVVNNQVQNPAPPEATENNQPMQRLAADKTIDEPTVRSLQQKNDSYLNKITERASSKKRVQDKPSKRVLDREKPVSEVHPQSNHANNVFETILINHDKSVEHTSQNQKIVVKPEFRSETKFYEEQNLLQTTMKKRIKPAETTVVRGITELKPVEVAQPVHLSKKDNASPKITIGRISVEVVKPAQIARPEAPRQKTQVSSVGPGTHKHHFGLGQL